MSLDNTSPSSFRNLVNLEVLDMSHASLIGCIPESLGNLENLDGQATNFVIGQKPPGRANTELYWSMLAIDDADMPSE
ncbi:hypothetical protein CcCBS67573_g10074 [Chytriomyces confervae]|uniref:Uncharacterized protein n=1 Tax=Chytriomyces confervae TaxID=246404 RepID=A0A507DH32_9FUNG|nr:hypothetical protein CcCBS67573_g10074 [Chytriomyces confervae]